MKYYLVGIKGAGMSALALILNDLGFSVEGFDDDKEHQGIKAMKDAGLTVVDVSYQGEWVSVTGKKE